MGKHPLKTATQHLKHMYEIGKAASVAAARDDERTLLSSIQNLLDEIAGMLEYEAKGGPSPHERRTELQRTLPPRPSYLDRGPVT
jgi:hypothetical protein